MLQYEKELGVVLQEIMIRWGVPGLAVGIVKGADIAHAKGFGVTDVSQCQFYSGGFNDTFRVGSHFDRAILISCGLLNRYSGTKLIPEYLIYAARDKS
jgi:hypothetical protein